MSKYQPNGGDDDGDYDFAQGRAKASERDFHRRNLTSFDSIYNGLQSKIAEPCLNERRILQPHYSALVNVGTAYSNKLSPADGICSHFLRRGFTKPTKFQLNAAVWSSDARWLILGTQSGDFALWEGDSLKVHKVVSIPAHKIMLDKDVIKEYIPITAMAWNNHGNALISGDNNGQIQYCDESFRNINIIKDAHTAPVKGLSFAPFDSKFVSGSEDGLVKIWAVGQTGAPEQTLADHQSDVKCCEWHPYRALIASGARDGLVKLWDPRAGAAVCDISSHKKGINCLSWNKNGNWLATGAKDSQVKIFDIRAMKEMETLRGHNSDVCSLGWHPFHETLLLSGGYNGSLIYWLVGHNQSAHTAIADAHRQSIDVIAWHPAGNCVATASHDCILKFWSREAPGSTLEPQAGEFQDTHPPVVGYGPLPGGGLTPAVIAASSSFASSSGPGGVATSGSSSASFGQSRFQGGTGGQARTFGGRQPFQQRASGSQGQQQQFNASTYGPRKRFRE